MITPNGRFKSNMKLCLSMSDFHPETWNPLWSVSAVLTGLLSFMLGSEETVGSVMTSDKEKIRLAKVRQREHPPHECWNGLTWLCNCVLTTQLHRFFSFFSGSDVEDVS